MLVLYPQLYGRREGRAPSTCTRVSVRREQQSDRRSCEESFCRATHPLCPGRRFVPTPATARESGSSRSWHSCLQQFYAAGVRLRGLSPVLCTHTVILQSTSGLVCLGHAGMVHGYFSHSHVSYSEHWGNNFHVVDFGVVEDVVVPLARSWTWKFEG